MILRRLSMFGFKSFADKTEIEFGEGLTSIVGPNGCGKSNVVDAIRWVFGEQKVSMLRGSSMQDVIFSGSQKRLPLNMAEVCLTIYNNKNILPMEYTEVSVSRRIFRNGESEYRLNRVPCRLKDITNLFLDTGLGSNSYTTIEHGMIDAILSEKAEERRVLFEEASGIGKYKQRRKESQRKLEATRQDLLRINDKVQDKTRDVQILARQVEKAQRYRKWYDELKSIEVGFENRQYTTLKSQMTERQSVLERLETDYESMKAKIAASDTRIEEMNLAVMEKENEVHASAQRVAAVNEQMAAHDKEISVCEENLRHVKENVTRLDHDMGTIEEQIVEKSDLRMKIEKSIVESESQLERHRELLTAIQEELARFDRDIAEKRGQGEALNQQQIRLINTIGDHRGTIGTLQNQLRNLLDRRERNERDLEQLRQRKEEYEESIELCRTQLQSAQQSYENLMQSRTVLLARIDEEDNRYRTFLEKEKQLEARIDASKSQLSFLKGLDAQFEGYEAGVKALLTGNLPGIRGIVADLIAVSDENVMGIVENLLSAEIQTVVFQTDQEMRSAIDHLGVTELGTARMASLERFGRQTSRTPAPRIEGNAVPLSSYVNVADEHRTLADRLFDTTYIVPTAKDAMDLSAQTLTDATFISAQDGVLADSNGTIIAGKPARDHAGILKRKRQIERLPGEIEKLQKEYERIVREKEMCIITRDEAKVALAEVNEKLSAGQRKQQEQETSLKHYITNLQSVDDRASALLNELAAIQPQIETAEQQIQVTETKLEEAQNSSRDLDDRIEATKGEIAGFDEARRGVAEKLTNAQLKIQGETHTIHQRKIDIKELTREVELAGVRKQQTLKEKEQSVSTIGDLENRIRSETEIIETTKQQRAGLEQSHAAVREEYNAMLNQIGDLRQSVKQDQTEMEELSTRVFTLKNEQARGEEKSRAIREKVFESYRIDLESPPEGLMAITDEDEEVDRTIRMYKERIDRVAGQVNMAAPEEYETKNKELIELTTQRDDLQKAVDDLENAIRKLNKEARVRFVETFEQVKRNFTSMFTSLFEGGEATIHLEENEDPLEAPIHINVRPGGKKMRGVQLLSGGERALTAISLLFALYMVKPSAFCILDELDAPLDDANVERFVRVLRQFSAQTQFIIITHNKRTMEAADVLYGVTQREQGISTIVSVRLEEAARHAA